MKKLLTWLITYLPWMQKNAMLEAQKEKLAQAYQHLNKAKRELIKLDPITFAEMILELELKANIIYLTLQELNDTFVIKPKGRFELEFIVNKAMDYLGKRHKHNPYRTGTLAGLEEAIKSILPFNIHPEAFEFNNGSRIEFNKDKKPIHGTPPYMDLINNPIYNAWANKDNMESGK